MELEHETDIPATESRLCRGIEIENVGASYLDGALVSPIEFTLRLDDYRALGGHMDDVRDLGVVGEKGAVQVTRWRPENPWPFGPDGEAG